MIRFVYIGFVLPVFVAAAMAPRLEPYLEVNDSYTQTEMQAAKESIALSLMGQLQFSVGDLLWMKTQEYLHGGLVYRMPTKAEEEMGYIPRDAVDVAAGLSHQEGVLMSPEAHRDWRGILGRIDREITPHAEHRHGDPVELIPWYQLVVKLNPHQERIYTMAGFFMSDSAQAPGDALAFLHEGLQANPWSWEIRGSIGRLLHDYADRVHLLALRGGNEEPVTDETIPTSEEQSHRMAATILQEATDLGLRNRVELAQRREVFDDYQKQLLRESYVMLAQSYGYLGEWDEALQTCEIGFEVTGHNHLKVVERTVTARRDAVERRAAGEDVDDSELASFDRSRTTSNANYAPVTSVRRAKDSTKPAMPLSVILRVAAPEVTVSSEAPELASTLLDDIRAYPYETADERCERLAIARAQFEEAIQALMLRKFVEVENVNLDAGSKRHFLTPLGLYVTMGQIGFDFWSKMEEEADFLVRRGMEIDLSQPQEAWERYPTHFN